MPAPTPVVYYYCRIRVVLQSCPLVQYLFHSEREEKLYQVCFFCFFGGGGLACVLTGLYGTRSLSAAVHLLWWWGSWQTLFQTEAHTLAVWRHFTCLRACRLRPPGAIWAHSTQLWRLCSVKHQSRIPVLMSTGSLPCLSRLFSKVSQYSSYALGIKSVYYLGTVWAGHVRTMKSAYKRCAAVSIYLSYTQVIGLSYVF